MSLAIFTFLVGLGIGACGGVIVEWLLVRWQRFRRTGPRAYRDPCGDGCRLPR